MPAEVTGPIFKKVLEFCEVFRLNGYKGPRIEKPLKSGIMSEVTSPTYAAFIDQFDDDTLQDLINAADALQARPLVELSTAKMGSIIRGLSVPEFRKRFSIENDFTPEEEAQPFDADLLTTIAALELELKEYQSKTKPALKSKQPKKAITNKTPTPTMVLPSK